MRLSGTVRLSIEFTLTVYDALQIAAMSSDFNCGNISDDQLDIWTRFEFWCEGVLFSLVGGFGLLGNIFSIIILASKSVKLY